MLLLCCSHLPESLVAAFAKRLSRLALVATAEDAIDLLALVSNLLLRHPALKRMICCEDTPAVSEYLYLSLKEKNKSVVPNLINIVT